ncbi:hypothetical protein AMECASPLE_004229 [Ameca splendens]|uniref:Secreted protein n=1 Tax=Ameca splendens TaxID=208324 RepID=A0ABV0YLK6_9TELE
MKSLSACFTHCLVKHSAKAEESYFGTNSADAQSSVRARHQDAKQTHSLTLNRECKRIGGTHVLAKQCKPPT